MSATRAGRTPSLPSRDEPGALQRVQIVPVVPLDARHEQRRAREARRDAAVLGAEDGTEVLHVHVVEGDVVDVRPGARPRRASWSTSGSCSCAMTRLRRSRDAGREAREVGRRARARDVGRVEEQRLQLAGLEELHEEAAMREDDERRRREAAPQKAYFVGYGATTTGSVRTATARGPAAKRSRRRSAATRTARSRGPAASSPGGVEVEQGRVPGGAACGMAEPSVAPGGAGATSRPVSRAAAAAAHGSADVGRVPRTPSNGMVGARQEGILRMAGMKISRTLFLGRSREPRWGQRLASWSAAAAPAARPRPPSQAPTADPRDRPATHCYVAHWGRRIATRTIVRSAPRRPW